MFGMCFKTLLVMYLFYFTHVSGAVPCQDSLDCARMNLGGYTCQNLRCVCDPNTDTGLFPCRGRLFGEKCGADFECAQEVNLVCARNEMRTCKCRRGYVWNIMNKICYMIDEHSFDNGNKGFDPVREIIIPGIIVMTIGAMVYLGIKLFCNCGKLWRRRRRQLTRELDEASHQQQATWVASYRDGTEDQETGATAGDPFIQNYGKPWFKIPNTRENNSVFSSLNGMETRSSPVLSPSSSFPLHPTPCMGLFLPSGSLAAAAAASSTASTTSPPPYEEALKHKVILSSYPTATTVILPTAPPTQMSQMAHAPGFAPTSSSNPTGPN